MAKIRLGFLASGRGSNLQAVIDQIQQGALDAEITCVISDVENAGALVRARDKNIPAFTIYGGAAKTKMEPDMERRIVECLEEHQVELVCLAGYMRIVKEALLKAFPLRIINIHPALLPSFPGLNVQKKAMNYGVKFSGCTVHFVDEGTDTGPIIIQAAVPVKDDDTEETLSIRILNEEHRIYSEAIRLIANKKIHIQGRRVLTS